MVCGVVLGGLFAETPLRYWNRLTPELRARTRIAVGACAAGVYAGARMIARAGGGLYVLGWAAIVGLAMHVFGAWSLLLGPARER